MPFDSTLTNKVSSVVEQQLPDFIKSEHPIFVNFLETYYKFLESAEITITATIDHIAQETVSSNSILDEVGMKIVTEVGSGTTGKFLANETITGSTSKATATILVDDLVTNNRLFISSQQHFKIGETITGSTSGATGVLKTYRGNPVQTIQQLLDLQDPDNTIDTFLNELVNQFIKIVPQTMASDLSKRNLIKNIRDMYAAKGSSEATKTFLRILFDEESEVTYPNKFMVRASKGDWRAPTKMRVEPVAGSSGAEIIGQTITGLTSGATAMVVDSSAFQQGIYSVTELTIDTDTQIGTFVSGETITAISLTMDMEMSFVISTFITKVTIDNDGSLYTVGDKIDIDSTIGNGFAEVEVSEIGLGGISGVIIENEGTNYKIGDPVSFTPNSADTNVDAAKGIVSVVGGSFLLEDSTETVNNYIVNEIGTRLIVASPKFALNGTDSSLTDRDDNIILERSAVSSPIDQDVGDFLLTEDDFISSQNYGDETDSIVIEEGTFFVANETDQIGVLKKVTITHAGGAYSKLPTVSVTSDNGAGAVIQSKTTDIGRVVSTNLKDGGFNYPSIPKTSFTGNFVLKNVTGNFAAGNSLTTHTGEVTDWDPVTKLLKVTIDDAERIKQETTGTLSQKLQQEQYQTGPYRMIMNHVLENDQTSLIETGEEHYNIRQENDGGLIVSEGASALVTKHGFITESGDRLVLDNAFSGVSGHDGYRILQEFDLGLVVTFLSGAGRLGIDNFFLDGDETTINFITEDGDYLIHEEYGHNFLLEDSLGADDYLIGETETLTTDNLILDSSALNTDVGSYLNVESEREYLGETISDGTGSGTIEVGDLARISLEANVSSVSNGFFGSTDHQVSEFTVRLQDSYYYQDFSYEVKVGQSTAAYLNELKGSIHPAGFIPFGKVNISSLISAAINVPTAGDIVDFTSDTTTFTPELASLLMSSFGPVIKRRLGVADNYRLGTLFEQVLLEDGEAIIIEDYLDGGRLNLESASIVPSVITGVGPHQRPRDVSLFSIAKVSMKLPWEMGPVMGTGLQYFGDTSSGGISETGAIELEDGYRTTGPTIMRDKLLLDGVAVMRDEVIVDQGAVMSLEDASNPNKNYGPSFNDLELIDIFNIITEDSEGNNTLVYETGTAGFALDPITTEHLFTSNVSLNDIIRPSVLLLDDPLQSTSELDALIPEDTPSGVNEGDKLRFEDSDSFALETRTGLQLGGNLLLEHSRFELENGADVGTIPDINKRVSKFPRFTRPSKIHIHTRGRIAWQDETTQLTFVLEDGDKILLDGINSAGVDAGEYLVSEKFSYELHPETPEGGFAILNASDASGTDANGYIEYEKGTWASLPGSYPVFVPDQPESWDASDGYFDSTSLTFDIVFGDG